MLNVGVQMEGEKVDGWYGRTRRENEGRTRERAAEGVGESGREEAEGGLGGFH